jgi:hypothetical protein
MKLSARAQSTIYGKLANRLKMTPAQKFSTPRERVADAALRNLKFSPRESHLVRLWAKTSAKARDCGARLPDIKFKNGRWSPR